MEASSSDVDDNTTSLTWIQPPTPTQKKRMLFQQQIPQPWMPQLVKYLSPANITTGCCNHWTLEKQGILISTMSGGPHPHRKNPCLKSRFEGDSRWDCSKALARNPYLKKTHCTPLRCPISTPLAPLIISKNIIEANDQWHDNGLIWWCWCSLGIDPGDLTVTLSADSQ